MDIKSMIENARQQHKKIIEDMFYEDSCTIIEYKGVKNESTKTTNKQEVTMYENQPCDLTYSSPKSANTTESATSIEQTPLLIISSDINIKPGSKIVVTKKSTVVDMSNPNTVAFKNSSVPSILKTHQEISLNLFKGWA